MNTEKEELPKEFIKCCKCGKGETHLVTQKVGKLTVTMGVLGKVSLRAIRPAGTFNPLSGKVHKNKPTEYICNECGNFK